MDAVSDTWRPPESPPVPGQIVGPAIQRLAAVRLGRAFLPLAALLLVGLSQMIGRRVSGWGPFLLAAGAPVSAGAMLAYGLGVVQRAFGQPHKAWWGLATAGGLVPLGFGVYVLGWRGLRLIAHWDGVWSVLTGVSFAILGFWTLRSWQKLSELETLATVMTLSELPGPDAGEGSEDGEHQEPEGKDGA